MSNVFLKEENIETSPPFVGKIIIKFISKKKIKKVSIFDLADTFKNDPWFSVTHLYMGIIFLYTLGLIEFKEPYIELNA
ncbi:hypothetical protein [Cyclobacterium sp. SYSU L10401]|uniref:hypothetical protein n=1 Tax=Cyclobacterium sp. SYSU L10401 TaxID=2678657 RepID=UPI0013D2D49B|nr:hypothetical protein [Cyclobacterium sp. SYSU L10401]